MLKLKPGYNPDDDIVDWDGSEAPMQTMADAYRDIEEGHQFWWAMGVFMHDWFGNHRTRREQLVKDPIVIMGPPTLEMWRTACFAAASVLYLCRNAKMETPEWAKDEQYILDEPWYMGIGAERPEQRARLRVESPTEFRAANIFCGERIWWNKSMWRPENQLTREA